MIQPRQRSPSAVPQPINLGATLFDNYGNYSDRAHELSQEEADQLVTYCLGIIKYPEKAAAERLKLARTILIEQGYRTPNVLPRILHNIPRKNLEDIVGLFGNIISRHASNESFLDSLARNVTAALSNPAQREGAARVLKLEGLCGAALYYLALSLHNDILYPLISEIFKDVAAGRQAEKAFNTLNSLLMSPAAARKQLAYPAAYLLSTLYEMQRVKAAAARLTIITQPVNGA